MSEHQLRRMGRVRSAFEVAPVLDKIAVEIGKLHGVQLNVTNTPEAYSSRTPPAKSFKTAPSISYAPVKRKLGTASS